jgi:hypothetical protein
VDFAGTPGARAQVNDSPDGLEIVLPAPRVWVAIVFLGLWLAGWATGEAFALRGLLGSAPLPVRLFLALWLALWSFGGTAALSVWLWLLFGRERVRLRPDALTLQREAFGLGPVKAYSLEGVSNLRARDLSLSGASVTTPGGQTPLPPEQAAAILRVAGIGGPGITFDYQGRPVRFGVALDPAEAHQVVAQLQARHAFPEGAAATSSAA